MMELYKPVQTSFVTNNTIYFNFMELLRNNNLSFEDLYADEALYD